MSLRDWLANGWLTEHLSSRQEISDLMRVVARDLADCKVGELSPDWRLNIAYNAALQSASAALAAAGYRASREAHHHRVIQSLAFTIQVDRNFIVQLDRFRKKRNLSDYERAGTVSDQEATEMAELAAQLHTYVLEWIKREHPNLLDME